MGICGCSRPTHRTDGKCAGLDSSATQLISFIFCHSDNAGVTRPILDINGCGADIHIRGYYGGLTIKNVTQNINISFDASSATLELDSSCTNGSINVGGITHLIDNSNGSLVYTDRTVTTLTEGGALTTNQATQLQELWQLQGLDLSNPMTIGNAIRSVASVTLNMVENPDGSVTLTRV